MKVCSVASCEKRVLARGWCSTHYGRWHAHGDPLVVATPYGLSLEEKITFYMPTRISGCMEWEGTKDPNGYGKIKHGGKSLYATRVVWELLNGPIPMDMLVRHTCDNPPCVNPKHLELGTYADNSNDMVVRERSAKGEDVASSKLTEEDVLAIRGSTDSRVTLAARHSVSVGAVRLVQRRDTWRHI